MGKEERSQCEGGKDGSVVGSVSGTHPQLTGLKVAGGEPVITSPPPSPLGWHTSLCLRETGQVARKTHPHHKCKIALLLLCFFGKNKMMHFSIMYTRIKNLSEYRSNNFAVKTISGAKVFFSRSHHLDHYTRSFSKVSIPSAFACQTWSWGT